MVKIRHDHPVGVVPTYKWLLPSKDTLVLFKKTQNVSIIFFIFFIYVLPHSATLSTSCHVLPQRPTKWLSPLPGLQHRQCLSTTLQDETGLSELTGLWRVWRVWESVGECGRVWESVESVEGVGECGGMARSPGPLQ